MRQSGTAKKAHYWTRAASKAVIGLMPWVFISDTAGCTLTFTTSVPLQEYNIAPCPGINPRPLVYSERL